MTDAIADRFWRKVEVAGYNDCWIWHGATNSKGYGRFCLHGRRIQAHRVAWSLYHDEDPGELLVCHNCDNPPCCNPGHLFIGTAHDNTQNMMDKGRGVGPRRPPRRRGPHRGETHYKANLSEAQVLDIRRLRSSGMRTKDIARIFDITVSHVSSITRRYIWRHL